MKIPFNLQFFAESEEIAEGVEVQNLAASDETEVTENPTTEEVEETQPTVEPTRTEEDSRFASVRRKAEEDARAKFEAERSHIDSEFKRLFGSYKNPVTGKAIESWQDYITAIEAQQKQAREEEFRSKGIDPKMIDDLINNSPAVRQANQIMQQNMENEARRRVSDDIKLISEMDSSIKNENDLLAHPSYQRVYELVSKNGLSLVDAYRLANYSTLATKQNEAVKQAAINQAKSKNHLDKTSGVASSEKDLIPIPASQLAAWRHIYPNLSTEQLTEKYNSVL